MATAGSTRPAGSACLAYRRTGAVPMLARRERFARAADPWVIGLRRRRPSLVVAVALANKTARIAWAVMQQESCSGGNIHPLPTRARVSRPILVANRQACDFAFGSSFPCETRSPRRHAARKGNRFFTKKVNVTPRNVRL